jgi:hypothetical protein
MAPDAACLALGEFDLGEGGEEAGGGPALLVGALGEAGAVAMEAGQAQRVSMAGRAWTSIGRVVTGAPPAGRRSARER